jgi:hypothetical protein
VVFLGRDERLGRDVALKVVSEDLGHDDARRARLRREARAAAAVSHPGVAQVFALEERPDGLAFLVSEHIEGRTIRAELEGGPLAPSVAIDTAVQVARALAAAHAQGVVHRDVKPENVVRARDGTVKVLDFGLASLDRDRGDARLTLPGTRMGTPGYMAPEQLRGEDTGPAADVYAVGLLLHEMLAGTLTGALTDAVVRAHPGLNALIRQCVSGRADDRPSMAALVAALEQARPSMSASGHEAAAAPPAVTPDTRWWQLHQVVMTALAVLMIYPAWLNRGTPLPGWIHTLIVLAVIAAAAIGATLRLHLVFTARVHAEQLAAARRRTALWRRVADVVMEATLLVAAAAALYRDRVWFAALFVTVAVCTTIAALIIEPATTEATFGEDA